MIRLDTSSIIRAGVLVNPNQRIELTFNASRYPVFGAVRQSHKLPVGNCIECELFIDIFPLVLQSTLPSQQPKSHS